MEYFSQEFGQDIKKPRQEEEYSEYDTDNDTTDSRNGVSDRLDNDDEDCEDEDPGRTGYGEGGHLYAMCFSRVFDDGGKEVGCRYLCG